MAKKNYRMKAETLGGKTVAQPVNIPVRPEIDTDYISRYVEMQSQRQEQQGNGLWPVGLREKMREACQGMKRKRDIKAAIAKIANLKPEDL